MGQPYFFSNKIKICKERTLLLSKTGTSGTNYLFAKLAGIIRKTRDSTPTNCPIHSPKTKGYQYHKVAMVTNNFTKIILNLPEEGRTGRVAFYGRCPGDVSHFVTSHVELIGSLRSGGQVYVLWRDSAQQETSKGLTRRNRLIEIT